jgi:predicted transcriptional regulator
MILQAVECLKRTLIFENRRNHLQVLYDILELCQMPQAKTYILRNTNTSFKLLESYLLQLQTSDFLELQPKTKKYVTTEEGQKFIDAWIMLKTMLYPQEVPVLSRNKKCTIHNNHFIAVPANNTNYVTIEKEKTPTSFS